MPQQVQLQNQNQFRIIPSVYPPINFFEGLVDPSEMETLWEIESLTNERLRQEVGDIFLVPIEDRVSGPGSSVIMAAFTHIGYPSRFSNGSYGVYYAAFSVETAIRETVYHREKFMRATHEPACELTMRLYRGKIKKDLHDIRGPSYKKYHNPDDYSHSQMYGSQLREKKSWGFVYNSVRHQGGCCIAIFRPPAVTPPEILTHLRYAWDGKKIVEVFDTRPLWPIR